MMQVSRRLFLRGALAVTAVATIPLVKAMPIRPVIWGDGTHCDADGLQALFDGKPYDLIGDGVRVVSGEDISLLGGRFRLTRGIEIAARARRVLLQNTEMFADGPVEYLVKFTGDHEYPIHVDGCRFSAIEASMATMVFDRWRPSPVRFDTGML